MKLRFDFVEIWSFYRHSEFKWNQILANSNGPKMSFLPILEVLNFDCSQFEQFFNTYVFYQISKFRVSKIAKKDIFGLFEFDKI